LDKMTAVVTAAAAAAAVWLWKSCFLTVQIYCCDNDRIFETWKNIEQELLLETDSSTVASDTDKGIGTYTNSRHDDDDTATVYCGSNVSWSQVHIWLRPQDIWMSQCIWGYKRCLMWTRILHLLPSFSSFMEVI
jgi:arabinogalactan endo-1,4-beta-galactosidase